ncbi:MAG TPA: DUF6268 family outer membrane beta-barrel protein [Haliangiales bacterium]|nr:DUF6268 family outer membrane beta-barrel protein [Haliangiales bacterium]
MTAQASYGFHPSASVDNAPGTELRVHSVRAASAARFRLEPRTFLTLGLSYRGEVLDYTGTTPPEPTDGLHTFEIPITLLHIFDEHWAFVGSFSPGLAGDFSGLDRHFRFSAFAVAAYSFSRRLSLGFGALLDYGAGRWLPLPAASIHWEIVDSLYLEAMGPVARFFYRFGDRAEVGAFFMGDVARWAVNGGGQSRTIGYVSIDVGGLLGVRMVGTTWLNVMIGGSVWRRYDVDGGTGDGKYYPDPGLVARVGIEIRLPGN